MSQENINIAALAEPTLLQWLAFGVSLVAALVAIVTAGGVIWNACLTRKTARQQATLEFLEKYKSDVKTHNARMIDLILQEKKMNLTGVDQLLPYR